MVPYLHQFSEWCRKTLYWCYFGQICIIFGINLVKIMSELHLLMVLFVTDLESTKELNAQFLVQKYAVLMQILVGKGILYMLLLPLCSARLFLSRYLFFSLFPPPNLKSLRTRRGEMDREVKGIEK